MKKNILIDQITNWERGIKTETSLFKISFRAISPSISQLYNLLLLLLLFLHALATTNGTGQLSIQQSSREILIFVSFGKKRRVKAYHRVWRGVGGGRKRGRGPRDIWRNTARGGEKIRRHRRILIETSVHLIKNHCRGGMESASIAEVFRDGFWNSRGFETWESYYNYFHVHDLINQAYLNQEIVISLLIYRRENKK